MSNCQQHRQSMPRVKQVIDRDGPTIRVISSLAMPNKQISFSLIFLTRQKNISTYRDPRHPFGGIKQQRSTFQPSTKPRTTASLTPHFQALQNRHAPPPHPIRTLAHPQPRDSPARLSLAAAPAILSSHLHLSKPTFERKTSVLLGMSSTFINSSFCVHAVPPLRLAGSRAPTPHRVIGREKSKVRK